MEKTAAVVLAAGVSSRMGRFKPLLTIDGETLVDRIVDTMAGAGASPVIVVTGYQADLLREHLQDRDVVLVHNDHYFQTDMLSSLILGLSALPLDTDRVLISPADVPLIYPQTLEALLAAKGDFIRPVFQGHRGHPVLMNYRILPQLEQYRGKGGLRGAIRACGITPQDVDVDDKGITMGCDVRDEYTQLLLYHREETQKTQPLQLDLRVFLQAETSFWNASTAQFLSLIETTGSIRSACACMHMSYPNACSTINEAERQLGYPLLVRNAGGPNGGGSELTPEGKAFLYAWRSMQSELLEQGNRIFQKYFPDGRVPNTEASPS